MGSGQSTPRRRGQARIPRSLSAWAPWPGEGAGEGLLPGRPVLRALGRSLRWRWEQGQPRGWEWEEMGADPREGRAEADSLAQRQRQGVSDRGRGKGGG